MGGSLAVIPRSSTNPNRVRRSGIAPVDPGPLVRAGLLHLEESIDQGTELESRRAFSQGAEKARNVVARILGHDYGVVERPLIPGPHLVSPVDAVGNEPGGVRPVEVAVPTATYTGWAIRKDEGGVVSLVPGVCYTRSLARTDGEDPLGRPGLQDLYRSRQHYVRRLSTYIEKSLGDKVLLHADAAAVEARAVVAFDRAAEGLE